MAMFTTANPEVEVTNRDKIKYLKRYINLDREIDRKLKEVDCWRAKLSRLTPVYSSQPKGGGSIRGKTENIIAKIVDLEKEIDADVDRLISIRDNIKTIIEAVEDDRERLLLQYRYLDGKTFEWIAAKMDLSWQWVHKLHSKALAKIILDSL